MDGWVLERMAGSVNTIMIRQIEIRSVVIHLFISAQTLEGSPALWEALRDIGWPVHSSMIPWGGVGRECLIEHTLLRIHYISGLAQDGRLGPNTHLATTN